MSPLTAPQQHPFSWHLLCTPTDPNDIRAHIMKEPDMGLNVGRKMPTDLSISIEMQMGACNFVK